MKRAGLFGFIILLSLLGFSVRVLTLSAQAPTEQSLSPLSGRFTLTAPSDWYVSHAVTLPALQRVFPLEALTIADSPATLDQLLYAEPDPFALKMHLTEGAAIFITAWPRGFLQLANMDASDLAFLFMLNGGDYADLLSLEYPHLYGEGVQIERDDCYIWAVPLVDEDGHLLLVIAISDDEHKHSVEAILESLNYHPTASAQLHDSQTLDTPVTILPHRLMIDVPSGWWTLDLDNNTILTLPDVSPNFLEILDSRSFDTADEQLFITAVPFPQAELPNFDLDPDQMRQDPALQRALGLEAATLGQAHFAPHTTKGGLTGLWLEIDLSATEGYYVFGLLLQGDPSPTLLIGFTATDQAQRYRSLVQAIFSTARPPE